MNQFQSDVITMANCRKMIRAGNTRGFSSHWMRAMNKTITLSHFSVVLDGDAMSLYCYEKGCGRKLRKSELPELERLFRRVLKEEVEPFLVPPKQFKPLAVDLGPLVELLTLILAEAPVKVRQKAERALRLAVEKPGDWLRKHGHSRGLTKPTKDLPQLAFLDALIDARAAAELDHRSEPEELGGELRSIGRRMGFAVEAPQDEDAGKALKTLRRSLQQAGWALIVVDIHSDSYPFFAIPDDNLERIRALMRKCGLKSAKL